MYRPSLLLPSDDYRGNLLEVGVASSGLVMEEAAYWITGILCWVFATLRVTRQTWSYAMIPALTFSLFACIIGGFRLINNYHWLLRSERRSRIIDIFGLAGQIVFCLSLALHFLNLTPFSSVVACSGCWYITVLLTNCWARSPYIWFRCHYFEFLIFVLVLEVYLKQAGFITWSWNFILWPAWFLCLSMLFFGILAWYFVRNEDTAEIDAVLRVFVSGILIMGFCYLLFLRLFAAWLDGGQVLVISWAVPLFLGQVISLIYSVIVAITYAAQTHVAEPLPSIPTSASHESMCGPPIMRDMRISLVKVGNNFYRLASVIAASNHADDVSEETPLHLGDDPRKLFLRVDDMATGYHNVICDMDERGGSSLLEPLLGSITGSPRTMSIGPDDACLSDTESQVPQNLPGLRQGDANTSQSVMHREPSVDEVESCIICYQKFPDALFLLCGHGGMCFDCAQTCFRRTGLCPTCRQRIDGVAAFDPQEAKEKESITAHVKDTK